MVEKLFPDFFLKNQSCAYFWINSLRYYTVCFWCMSSWGLSKNIEDKLQTTCFYLILSFLKHKKRLELVSLLYFVHDFEGKYLSCNILVIFSHRLVVFTSWDIGQYVYCNRLLIRLWRYEFWNQPYVSNQVVFSARAKSQDNNLNIFRTKRAFKME